MYRGKVYSIKGAAYILGISPDEVEELLDDGVMDYIWKPSVKFGEVRVIPDYEFENYLEIIGMTDKTRRRFHGPMQVKIEMTMEIDERYDEDAAKFFSKIMNLYRESKEDDLY